MMSIVQNSQEGHRFTEPPSRRQRQNLLFEPLSLRSWAAVLLPWRVIAWSIHNWETWYNSALFPFTVGLQHAYNYSQESTIVLVLIMPSLIRPKPVKPQKWHLQQPPTSETNPLRGSTLCFDRGLGPETTEKKSFLFLQPSYCKRSNKKIYEDARAVFI